MVGLRDDVRGAVLLEGDADRLLRGRTGAGSGSDDDGVGGHRPGAGDRVERGTERGQRPGADKRGVDDGGGDDQGGEQVESASSSTRTCRPDRRVDRGRLTDVCFFTGASIEGSSVTAGSLSYAPLRQVVFAAGLGSTGQFHQPERNRSVQPGIAGLRGTITAAWEEDLRAVRGDRYEIAAGKEALAFIQRCYSLVSELRAPIQKVWGIGGHVHVADSPDIAGPGPRISQTRLRLRNHGDLVGSRGVHLRGRIRAAQPRAGAGPRGEGGGHRTAEVRARPLSDNDGLLAGGPRRRPPA